MIGPAQAIMSGAVHFVVLLASLAVAGGVTFGDDTSKLVAGVIAFVTFVHALRVLPMLWRGE